MADPLYSSEYVDAAADVLRRFLVPALAAAGPLDAHAVAPALAPFKGHRMAKAALEMGVLDAELRAAGPVVRPRARRGPRPGAVRGLGRDHGQHPGAARRRRRLPRRGLRPDQAQDRARLGRRAGARGPRAVGDDVLLQVDANTAYTLADARHLARLDPFDLLLIEQPLDEEDVLGHADLAEADPDAGLPGRVDRLGAGRGGRDPARRLLRSSTSSPAGSAATSRRAGSTTSASRTACRSGAAACSRPGSAGRPTSRSPRCPGFTLPGDTSASGRYYRADITEPFVLDDGHLAVPTGPGLGVRAAARTGSPRSPPRPSGCPL